VGSLGFAVGLLSGRVRRLLPNPPGADPRPRSSSWLGRQLADLSVPRAGLVGVLTHKPGLFYLAALSAITSSTSSKTDQVFQVALYNAIWFAMPVAALALATRRPAELRDFLRRATTWVWRRQREILMTVFGVLGMYLVVRGLMELGSASGSF
jgi:hypothetical protein